MTRKQMAGRGRWVFQLSPDRVAQEVTRRYLEPILEPVFHPDSYGYRPGKTATDAVGKARERCWRYDSQHGAKVADGFIKIKRMLRLYNCSESS